MSTADSISRQGRILALLAALSTLFACASVGPDFEEPTVDWLADWQTDLYGQVAKSEQSEADLTFWWQLFDDPVLHELIEAAKAENLSLRVAGLRILESRAVLRIAGAAHYPQLQQVGSALTYINNESHGGISSGGDESVFSYQTNFTLGWELDFWGRFKRGLESADAAFFASITQHQDAQVLLAAQLAELYYAYLTNVLRIQIAENNARIQARSLDITNKLYLSGQNAELDVQQARTQYYATLSTIPELEIQSTRIHNAIGVLLARAPGDLPELSAMPTTLPSVSPILIRSGHKANLQGVS